MSDKKNKNSFKNYQEIIKDIRDIGDEKVIYRIKINNKNKDNLLQVRIDEEYDKKLSVLEEMLGKNRSSVIRMSIDNLLETCTSKNKNNIRNNKKQEQQQEEEDILLIVQYLMEIYKSAEIKDYVQILKKKLDTLEELKKSEK